MLHHSNIKVLSSFQLFWPQLNWQKDGKLESWNSLSFIKYSLYCLSRPWISKFEIGGGNKIAHYILYLLQFSGKMEYQLNYYGYHNLCGDLFTFCFPLWTKQLPFGVTVVTIIQLFVSFFLRTKDANEIQNFEDKNWMFCYPT